MLACMLHQQNHKRGNNDESDGSCHVSWMEVAANKCGDFFVPPLLALVSLSLGSVLAY